MPISAAASVGHATRSFHLVVVPDEVVADPQGRDRFLAALALGLAESGQTADEAVAELARSGEPAALALARERLRGVTHHSPRVVARANFLLDAAQRGGATHPAVQVS